MYIVSNIPHIFLQLNQLIGGNLIELAWQSFRNEKEKTFMRVWLCECYEWEWRSKAMIWWLKIPQLNNVKANSRRRISSSPLSHSLASLPIAWLESSMPRVTIPYHAPDARVDIYLHPDPGRTKTLPFFLQSKLIYYTLYFILY